MSSRPPPPLITSFPGVPRITSSFGVPVIVGRLPKHRTSGSRLDAGTASPRRSRSARQRLLEFTSLLSPLRLGLLYAVLHTVRQKSKEQSWRCWDRTSDLPLARSIPVEIPAGMWWTIRLMARVAVLVGIAFFCILNLAIASGATNFVHECESLICGQLHQAVFAAIGGGSLFVAGHLVWTGKSSAAARVAFWGTFPILIVHVILVITDPHEWIFFPLSSTPPPVVSGLLLLTRRRGLKP